VCTSATFVIRLHVKPVWKHPIGKFETSLMISLRVLGVVALIMLWFRFDSPGGVRGLAFVSGAGISQSVRGSVSHGLLHVRWAVTRLAWLPGAPAEILVNIAKLSRHKQCEYDVVAVTGFPRWPPALRASLVSWWTRPKVDPVARAAALWRRWTG
jgi:hypothetical protein